MSDNLDNLLHEASFNFKYVFGFILPVLPLPTTSPLGFQSLVNELRRFKIVPSDINIESPSNNLNDLVLSIKFLNRLILRLTHGSLEILMGDIKFADFESGLIDAVLFVICKCLKSMSIIFEQSIVKLSWGGHLGFDPCVADIFLKKATVTSANLPISFVPCGVLYKLNLNDNPLVIEPSLGISESMFYEDSLFVDFSVAYNIPSEPTGIVKRFHKDLDSVLKSVIEISAKSL